MITPLNGMPDLCACWGQRLERLWELESRFDEAERTWRRTLREMRENGDSERKRALVEARLRYQEAGLEFYLAAAGESFGSGPT